MSFQKAIIYTSFKDLLEAEENYDRENLVCHYVRTSEVIDPTQPLSDRLKYKPITFSCVHGGNYERIRAAQCSKTYLINFIPLSLCLKASESE